MREISQTGDDSLFARGKEADVQDLFRRVESN